MLRPIATRFALLGLLVSAAACDVEPLSLNDSDVSLMATAEPEFGARPASSDPNNPVGTRAAVVDWERFELCKRWDGPGPHGVAEFQVDVDRERDGSIDLTFMVNTSEFYGPDANGWSCIELWEQGANGGELTVTETQVFGGAHPYTVTSTIDTVSDGTLAPLPVGTAGGAVVTGIAGGHSGVTAFFVNTATPPPPPPSGGEGCTPGYWKQPQHFDSWPIPYGPNMLFSDVFEDAFPGMTLRDVAAQGGGGIKALGRHTVAALLNGTNSGVSYDLSTAQVIDGFNAVFPGGKRDYNAVKNQFAGFNEQGCPLN